MQNRTRAGLVVMFGLMIAAGVYAELKKGDYAPAQLGVLRQPAPAELSPDANFQVSSYPVPAVELAPGEGLQDVQIYCNICHGTRYITMQATLPAATWEAEVNKMIKTYGAAIPDDSTKKIIQYLQTHYTADTRKQ